MKKILIIEDDQIVANVYSNKFAVDGYQVEIAGDGESGLAAIHSFRPDLVLLDLMLPKLSGVELMTRLRAEPEFEKLPIIVFSNTYLSNIIKEAWKAGATKCLSKSSCTPKQVLEVVRSLLTVGHVAGRVPEAAPVATSAPVASKISFPQKPKDEEKPAPASKLPPPDPAPGFLAGCPVALLSIRNSLQVLIKTADEPTRMQLLDDMYAKVHSLTGGAGAVGLHSISQVSDALEALIRELRDRTQSINPSTLRTIANAVDFLEVLVKRGKAADFQKPMPARILVVDDELLSRRAITHALERAKLTATDMEDPIAALKLATDTPYDLIFLDADMPGMNGFELCAKLRTLPLHKKTPVVFVTGLNDFEARANSTMAGANDFIAKPFPFVELAVKALIYIIRGRLEPRK